MRAFVARFPRVSAWGVNVGLVGTLTFAAIAGLRLGTQLLEPRAPSGVEAVHGVVVAVEASGIFAVRVAGHPAPLLFHPAAGAPISLAHLRRHVLEHAGTDVTYVVASDGELLAWSAD